MAKHYKQGYSHWRMKGVSKASITGSSGLTLNKFLNPHPLERRKRLSFRQSMDKTTQGNWQNHNHIQDIQPTFGSLIGNFTKKSKGWYVTPFRLLYSWTSLIKKLHEFTCLSQNVSRLSFSYRSVYQSSKTKTFQK